MLRRPSLALRDHVTVHDAADTARVALRAFLTLEPDKHALAEWLGGPYHVATSFGPRHMRSQPSSPPTPHHTTPMNIHDLVSMSQDVVRAAVDASRLGVDELVELLPELVKVIPVHDAFGGHGFVALDEPRMRLADRALCLLAADYLTHPDDFVANADTLWAIPRPSSPVSCIDIASGAAVSLRRIVRPISAARARVLRRL